MSIHEVGRDEQTLFIVSEHIDGMDLKEQLDEWWFTPRDAAELIRTVAEAVHYAHQQAVARAEESVRSEQAALQSESVARPAEQTAKQERDRATANYKLARKAVNDIFHGMSATDSRSQVALMRDPAVRPVRKFLVGRILAYQRGFIEKNPGDVTW